MALATPPIVNNNSRKRYYLHDLARASTIVHGERFAISFDENPGNTMIYQSKHFTDINRAKNYLQTIWGKTI